MCALAVLAAGAPASAQSQQPRGGPFTGLFRGSPKDQPHTLDIRASGFTAWDDNLSAQVPGAGGDFGFDPRNVKKGIANGFQSSLAYGFRHSGVRSQFSVGADANVQEFASDLGGDQMWFYGYNLFTGLTTKITNKTSFTIGAGSAYAPYYQYAPFFKSTTSEESPVGADFGFAIDSQLVLTNNVTAAVENRFSKKSSISGGVAWDQRVIPETPDASIDMRSARVMFSHSLTRKLGFHVGYSLQEARYAKGEPVRSNNMEIGLGYGEGLTLSLSRHTTLRLSAGVSIARNGDPALVVTTGKSTALAVEGGATLSQSIGRAWGASLGYVRATSYLVGFVEPMMTDAANAGISGPIFERLQFSAGAGASRGQPLFSASNGHVITYTASTRLTYALFSHLGLYGQASYYRYSIPLDFLNFAFVPKLDRRSVSVGLNTWIPLIKPRRERRDPVDQTTTGQP